MSTRLPGLFVTIDGPGGSGKTTLTASVAQRLREAGTAVHVTREPSDGPIGLLARANTDSFHGRPLALLVAADRFHHLESEVVPNLLGGAIVLCDRYVPSSWVLQQRDGLDLHWIRQLNAAAPPPQLSIVLTGDAEELWHRIVERGRHNRFEAGVADSAAEVALFAETVGALRECGWSIVEIDTTEQNLSFCSTAITEAVLSMSRKLQECSYTAPLSTGI